MNKPFRKIPCLSCFLVMLALGVTCASAQRLPQNASADQSQLEGYPNLILWIAGHRHRNVVTPWPSIDPAHPGKEYGFWEVETASSSDFPQQVRTFEIRRNSDNTISILTTDVDPAVKDGSLAALSRSDAIAAQQIFNPTFYLPPTGGYNAELVKQPSPAMQAQIQNYGAPLVAACKSYWQRYQ